jgi:hypothetical protein
MLTKVEIKTNDLMSVPQAAKILKRPKMTLYRWIYGRKIIGIELGGVLFIPTKEVERLQNERAPASEGALNAQGGGP